MRRQLRSRQHHGPAAQNPRRRQWTRRDEGKTLIVAEIAASGNSLEAVPGQGVFRSRRLHAPV
jgi:hypothetical protein